MVVSLSPSAGGPGAERLFDDLGLMVRARLSEEMKRQDLWLDADARRDVLAAQKVLGQSLLREIFSDLALDPGPGVRNAFGSSNQDFRSRAAMRLSFGYAFSHGLHCFALAGEPPIRDPAIQGAIFNLAISQFDYICDRLPGGVERLSSIVSEAVLLRLLADARGQVALREVVEKEAVLEIRMLAQTMTELFARLHAPVRVCRDSICWKKLSELFFCARRAQLLCSRDPEARLPAGELAAACKAKSTLPFLIIAQFILLHETALYETGHSHLNAAALDALARSLATAFWLVDDLADLAEDFRIPQANSILVGAGLSSRTPPGEAGRIARALFDDGHVDDAISRACTSLRSALSMTNGVGYRCDAYKFDRIVLAYLRSWIE